MYEMEYTHCVILLLFSLMYECAANYCTQYYGCYKVCYRIDRYTTNCKFWGWGRCTKYRPYAYPCLTTCDRTVCCDGYTGEGCKTPICFGSTSPLCPNGGRCIGPDNCLCPSGFSGPDCSKGVNDVSCGREQMKCDHKCTYKAGSYSCTCFSGYELQQDSKSCKDIDECKEEMAECDQICINTNGSFTCLCNGQMELGEDGKTCIYPTFNDITNIIIGWLIAVVLIIIFIGAITCFTMIFVAAYRKKKHSLSVSRPNMPNMPTAPMAENAENYKLEDMLKSKDSPVFSTC